MKFIQLKEFGKYILRVIAFLFGLRYLYLYPMILFMIIILSPIMLLSHIIFALGWTSDFSDNTEYAISFSILFIGAGLASIASTYLFAKICGIFKKLDNFKKWQAFSVVVLISVLVFVFIYIDKSNNGDMVFPYAYAISVITAYFLYIFLNFLTKKFPVPFEKIKYYSSIEFYKNIFKNS